MKVRLKKGYFLAIAVFVGILCATIGFSTMSHRYAHASDSSLRYVIATEIQVEEGNISVTFPVGSTEKTVRLPEFDYYESEPETYDGRILQAVVPDQTLGILSAKLIRQAKFMDLPPLIASVLTGDVFELNYYEDESSTLYGIYFSVSPLVQTYISEHVNVDLSEGVLLTAKESLSSVPNFMRREPLIYNLAGERIDSYPQASQARSLTEEFNPSLPADCLPGMFDSYTDSDNFMTDTAKTLTDYIYGSNLGGNDEVSTNDDIIQLVPMELFRSRGDYVYIGREYGFFVSTKLNADFNGNCNFSDVGIFDVTYTDSAPINMGAEIETKAEIKFLYFHTYSYLTKADIYDWNNFYDSSLTEIVTGSRWEGTDEYYLHNVSFGGVIYDEVKLNPGQPGYSESLDTSAHLIQSRYNFYGSTLDRADSVDGAKAGVKFLLGKIGAVPSKLGTFCKVGSKVWNIAEKILNFQNPLKVEHLTFEFDSEINIRNSKSDYLCKGLSGEISAPETGDIALLRPNQRAECIYLLGNYHDNWIRMYHSFDVHVSRLDRGVFGTDRNLVALGNAGSTYSRHLQEKKASSKPIALDASQPVNILPNGFNRFEFIPDYSGNYVFDVSASKNADLVIRNNSKQIVATYENGKTFTHTFTKNELEKYYIDVSLHDSEETEVFSGSLSLKKSDIGQSNSCAVEPGGSWAIGFSSNTSETFKILCNNTNLRLKIVSPSGVTDFGTGSTERYYRFNQSESYIVAVENPTSSTQYADLRVSELASVSLNSSQSYTVYPGMTYWSYSNQTDFQESIVFSANGIQGQDHSWDIKSANWGPGSGTIFTGEGVVRVTVPAHSKFYIGLENLSSAAASIYLEAKFEANAYQWYVNNNLLDGQDLYLARGESATLKFKVNNREVTNFLAQSNDNFQTAINVIQIKSDARLGTVSYLYASMITDYPLIVHPLYEESFDYSIVNGNELYLSWGNFKGLSKIKFTLQSPDGRQLEIETGDLYGTTSGKYRLAYQSGSSVYNFTNIIRTSLGYTGWENCTVHLNWIDVAERNIAVYNPTWNYRIYNDSQELDVADKTFDPLFGGGSGASEDDPHLIGSVRHLNNIRYRSTPSYGTTYINGYYEMYQNVTLSSSESWTPIPYQFAGTFTGIFGIYNLTIALPTVWYEENTYHYFGLFETVVGEIKYAFLYSPHIYCSQVSSGGYVSVGAFAGELLSGALTNCKVENGSIDIPRRYSWVGGLAGTVDMGAVIKSSENRYCTITGNGELGGITGVVSLGGILNTCRNYADVKYTLVAIDHGFNNAGGIAARAMSTNTIIKNCINYGDVWYLNPIMEKNQELAPCMARIVGYLDGASQNGNEAYGEVKTGSLYSFKTGFIWTTTHDQARNCHEVVGFTV